MDRCMIFIQLLVFSFDSLLRTFRLPARIFEFVTCKNFKIYQYCDENNNVATRN